MWAGIKTALNSTMGTSEFKSLDQLIDEKRDLVASDDLYRYIFTGRRDYALSTAQSGTNQYTVAKFKTNRNGSLRLKYAATQNSTKSVAIKIIKGTTEIIKAVNQTQTVFSEDIDFNKNEDVEIKIMLQTSNSVVNASVENLSICARELDLSGITILEGV